MDFNYKVRIGANTEEVFAALTNPFQIEIWSGYPADMKPERGYVFSLWEGDISGVNIDVVPNKKIVQEWFFGDNENPSIVTLLLKNDNGATQLELTHTNIPAEVYDEITDGWRSAYIGSMKDMLEIS